MGEFIWNAFVLSSVLDYYLRFSSASLMCFAVILYSLFRTTRTGDFCWVAEASTSEDSRILVDSRDIWDPISSHLRVPAAQIAKPHHLLRELSCCNDPNKAFSSSRRCSLRAGVASLVGIATEQAARDLAPTEESHSSERASLDSRGCV